MKDGLRERRQSPMSCSSLPEPDHTLRSPCQVQEGRGGKRMCSITSRRWSQHHAECRKLQDKWPGLCNHGNKVSGAERGSGQISRWGGLGDIAGQYRCRLLGSPFKNKRTRGREHCRTGRETESTGWVFDAVMGLSVFGGATMIGSW